MKNSMKHLLQRWYRRSPEYRYLHHNGRLWGRS